MRADGNGHLRERYRRRPYRSAIGLAAVSLSVALIFGCYSAKSADPAALFQSIQGDFLHGNLDVARRNADRERQEFAARDPGWSMRFRLLEAEILTYQGRRPEVLALLGGNDVSYPASGDVAIQRDLFCALAHAGLGQMQQSDAELRTALQLAAEGHSGLRGEVLQAEARVELYRDHLPKAAALYKQSLQAAREHGNAFLEASDSLNLGLVAVDMQHYDEALALLNGAADLARPIQARQVMEASLGNLGVAYFQLGDFEKALAEFQQAEQEAKEIGTTSAQITWLWDAGSSSYELGDVQEAMSCLEQALQAAKVIDEREEAAGINTELAFVLYQQGQFEAAKAHSDDALRAARRSGDKSAETEPLFLQALLAAHQGNAPGAERLLMQVYAGSADDPSLRGEVESALGNFYAAGNQPAQAERWYRRSIQTFEAQRDQVKNEELKLPFFANGNALYRDYADFLIASHRPDEALQLLDLGRARTLQEGLGMTRATSRPVDAQHMAASLRAVILFYSLGPKRSCLWAVTPRHTGLFVLPKQSDIDSLVQRYQKSILKSSDPVRDTDQAARSLYDTLVGPAASMIPGGSRVFVIADGALNGLNFETLLAPGADRPHYWIEDVIVTNANSMRMLAQLDEPSASWQRNDLLLIGDPVPSGANYDDLPNAAAEVAGIQKHFPPDRQTVLTQAQAVPAAYAASRPDRFAYIHFVAHGTASRLSPLDSAVVLSAAPGHPESFKLYARDIVRYPLHARLVTISACYGSGLRAYAGEGLVGLSWAFLRAGSHNVIGALWEASDASTPMLMDRLYSELASGSRPDAALRDAKLSLIHSSGVYRKPLYWAAFQLYAGS